MTRKWWPMEYADEVMGQSKASAVEWLYRMPDGAIALHRLEEEDGDNAPPRIIQPGDRVEFLWWEPRPSVAITIHADGYSLHSAPPAVDAVCFWVPGEFDTSGDSLDEFVKFWREMDGEIEERLDVACGRWADETFKLIVGETGQPSLVPVESAATTPSSEQSI